MATVTRESSPKNSNRVAKPVNPYQTPNATSPVRKSSGPIAKPIAPRPAEKVPALHSDRAILGSTLFGGVIAGAILVARNQVLLGRKTPAMLFLSGAIAWQAILIALSLSLPFEVPSQIWMCVSATHAVLFQLIAKQLFAQPYARIAEGHGQWAPWGLAAAAVVVTLIGVGSIATAIAMCL